MTTHNHDAGTENPDQAKRAKREFPPVPGAVDPEVEKLHLERREAEADSDDEKVAAIDKRLAEFEKRNK